MCTFNSKHCKYQRIHISFHCKVNAQQVASLKNQKIKLLAKLFDKKSEKLICWLLVRLADAAGNASDGRAYLSVQCRFELRCKLRCEKKCAFVVAPTVLTARTINRTHTRENRYANKGVMAAVRALIRKQSSSILKFFLTKIILFLCPTRADRLSFHRRCQSSKRA